MHVITYLYVINAIKSIHSSGQCKVNPHLHHRGPCVARRHGSRPPRLPCTKGGHVPLGATAPGWERQPGSPLPPNPAVCPLHRSSALRKDRQETTDIYRQSFIIFTKSVHSLDLCSHGSRSGVTAKPRFWMDGNSHTRQKSPCLHDGYDNMAGLGIYLSKYS